MMRRPSTSFVDKTINLPRGEIFYELPEFHYNRVWHVDLWWKECPKPTRFVQSFWYDTDLCRTDRQTGTRRQHSVARGFPSMTANFGLYDAIWGVILTCAQKLASISLIYRAKPTTKKWNKGELKAKTSVLRRVGKQSGESVESVLKKKKKATVGRICRKGMKEWGVINDESG